VTWGLCLKIQPDFEARASQLREFGFVLYDGLLCDIRDCLPVRDNNVEPLKLGLER
jgi:hypothetical protein